MASIFTFDHDPPRVSSPWGSPRGQTPIPTDRAVIRQFNPSSTAVDRVNFASKASHIPMEKIQPESEDGPTEYKQHLLLRPRREFLLSSYLGYAIDVDHAGCQIPSFDDTDFAVETPPSISSSPAYQMRQRKLTTQMLWRLQQSSPYHASSHPVLPSSGTSTSQASYASSPPASLIPGLEESQGALYEIGVGDDGALVGLAADEMQESLRNLRNMAASLGCSVEILRMMIVGDCKWVDQIRKDFAQAFIVEAHPRQSKLWVAEAYVCPRASKISLRPSQPSTSHHRDVSSQFLHPERPVGGDSPNDDEKTENVEQLRVSLIGPTMSGKSSLLGSLTAATLDNGRGKSRLSLLKHRHEIASGMTSSVTQELVGYRFERGADRNPESVDIINFASGNVTSWNDIHSSTVPGRLVLISDSAGHPRFRRTTVRGLIGWAPHWTLLCVPADDAEGPLSRFDGSSPLSGIAEAAPIDSDVGAAHLDLCLILNAPLAIVVTKMDAVSKSGLRQTLSKLLTRLKAAGRRPVILSDAVPPSIDGGDLPVSIDANDVTEAQKIVKQIISEDKDCIEGSAIQVTPIVLTSAVSGAGIAKLHALLCRFPIPAKPVPKDHYPGTASIEGNLRQPSSLFLIEDVYSKLDPVEGQMSPSTSPGSKSLAAKYIVSGHLRYGSISAGDELFLGPFPAVLNEKDSNGETAKSVSLDSKSISAGATLDATHGRTHSQVLHSRLPLPSFVRNTAQDIFDHEWRRVRVISIRNLRLPVSTLFADQVGTIGLSLSPATSTLSPDTTQSPEPSQLRLRKGMVLVGGASAGPRSPHINLPAAHRAFVAHFANPIVRAFALRSVVVVYVGSVRAGAKVIAVALAEDEDDDLDATTDENDDDDGIRLSDVESDDDDAAAHEEPQSQKGATLISFQFLAVKEFVEMGAKVLVMPGGPGVGGRGLRGNVAGSAAGGGGGELQGFVGRVVEGLG